MYWNLSKESLQKFLQVNDPTIVLELTLLITTEISYNSFEHATMIITYFKEHNLSIPHNLVFCYNEFIFDVINLAYTNDELKETEFKFNYDFNGNSLLIKRASSLDHLIFINDHIKPLDQIRGIYCYGTRDLIPHLIHHFCIPLTKFSVDEISYEYFTLNRYPGLIQVLTKDYLDWLFDAKLSNFIRYINLFDQSGLLDERYLSSDKVFSYFCGDLIVEYVRVYLKYFTHISANFMYRVYGKSTEYPSILLLLLFNAFPCDVISTDTDLKYVFLSFRNNKTHIPFVIDYFKSCRSFDDIADGLCSGGIIGIHPNDFADLDKLIADYLEQ